MKILFLIFITIFHFGSGIVVKKHITTEDPFFSFHKFGFEKGGQVDLKIVAKPAHNGIFFLMCEQKDYYKIYQEYNHDIDRCSYITKNAYVSCPIFPLQINGTLELNKTISTPGMYHLLFANCFEGALIEDTSYTVSGLLLNPGNEHLSTEYLPLPTVYTLFFPLWLIIIVGFTVNWIMHLKQKIPLHRVIYFIPIAKALQIGYSFYYWRSYSKHGEVSLLQTIIYHGSAVVFEALLFTTIFLISKGWSVTRTSLTRIEKQSIVVCVGALVFTWLFYQLLDGYYLFAVVIMYIVTMKFSFSNIDHNVKTLRNQFLFLRQHGEELMRQWQ